jgi:hypothetical protein
MNWTYLALQLIPQIGDIYWCHLPEFGSDERLDGAVGKRYAPVLVRALDLNIQEGKGIIHGSYGIRTIKKQQRVWFDLSSFDLTAWLDLIIDDPAEMREVGLRFPARFDLADEHTLQLIWCRELFHDQEGRCPHRIGQLNDSCRRRLNHRLRWRRYVSDLNRLIRRTRPSNRD